MYKHTYELPKEEELTRLPLKVLQMINIKNQLSKTGTKGKLSHQLLNYWQISMKDYTWPTEINCIDCLEAVEVTQRGKVQSSLSFSLLTISETLCIPVFGHDYQEE